MEHNNQDLQFKTNINCSGCVASVKPHLDNVEGIGNWEVDTANKDKILTIKSNGITEHEVIATIKKAGFTIEPINKQ